MSLNDTPIRDAHARGDHDGEPWNSACQLCVDEHNRWLRGLTRVEVDLDEVEKVLDALHNEPLPLKHQKGPDA